MVLSLLVGHWTDAVIIAVLLAMNGVVAFAEEHQAAGAIAALEQRLATTARVLSDGGWVGVAVRELVPGDVVRVRLGDVVPADLRVLDIRCCRRWSSRWFTVGADRAGHDPRIRRGRPL